MRALTSRRALFALGASAVGGMLLAASVVALAGASGGGSLTARVQATDVVAGFDRARASGDTLPATARASLVRLLGGGAPTEALDPGAPLLDRSRKAGSSGGPVTYLVPTDKGQVCYVIDPSGVPGCTDGSGIVRAGIEWGLVDQDGFDAGKPTIVYGLVGAQVEGVSVVAGGRPASVPIGGGSFYAEFPARPTAIVVRFLDGSTRELAVPTPPAP